MLSKLTLKSEVEPLGLTRKEGEIGEAVCKSYKSKGGR